MNFRNKLILMIPLMLIMLQVASSQSVVCTTSQIANQSNAKLLELVGNSTWTSKYYTFENFTTSKILYNANNYTRNTTDAYFIDAWYNKFSGPGNLTNYNPTQIEFKLTNNSNSACSNLIFYSGFDVVLPYNISKFITPQQATGIARSKGYNISFNLSSLMLGEVANKSSNTTDFLAPLYSYRYSSYNSPAGIPGEGGGSINVNAQNGTLTTFSFSPASGPTGQGNTTLPTTTITSQNTTTITNESNTNTNNSFATESENFIVNKVGLTYFNKYIIPELNVSSNVTGYGFVYIYNIPYANGSTIKSYQGVIIFTNQDGVQSYIGPSTNYTIYVSKSEAIEDANMYGLSNAYAASIFVAYNTTKQNQPLNRVPDGDNTSGYDVVWAVTNKPTNMNGDCINGTNYSTPICGVFVDVKTGKILGQFIAGQAIIGNQVTTVPGTALLGNFSVFTPIQATTTISINPNAPQGIFSQIIAWFKNLFNGI
jgi:hypothetical protein